MIYFIVHCINLMITSTVDNNKVNDELYIHIYKRTLDLK